MPPDPSQSNKENPLSEGTHQGPLFMGPPSSDEDTDSIPSNEYQLLPQDPENLTAAGEENDSIDYSSLSSLMASYAANGPTNIATEDTPQDSSGITPGTSRETDPSDAIPHSHNESTVQAEKERQAEYLQERANLWNTASPSDRIQLDEDKKEQIKSAMANFVLPPSSIPDWAASLSDEEWNDQIASRLQKHD